MNRLLASLRSLRRRACVPALLVVALLHGCAPAGDAPASLRLPPRIDRVPATLPPTLTVVSTNVANAFAVSGITWEMKMDRLAALIAASGQVPDIISMTESSGWTSCSTPASDNSGDYDMVDRLIWRLRTATGVSYRVAYLIGAEGAFGWGRCHYFTGDTLLYRADRLANLTPADVATRAQVAHNDNLLGFLVRRSLPLCSRGAHTNIAAFEQLIDGPPQVDKCNRPTPAAPAWALQQQVPGGGFAIVATMARFGLVGVPGSSFDVVTTHPTFEQEAAQKTAIEGFIAGLVGPPYRTTRPYYPLVVLGDFNSLVESAPPWPPGTTQAFRAPEDVMAVSLGTGTGALPPVHLLKMNLGATLPGTTPCRFDAATAFSDHCGLMVRFTE